MKIINKIVLVQIGLVIGGIISFLMIDVSVAAIVLNYITVTMGYACGLLHGKD